MNASMSRTNTEWRFVVGMHHRHGSGNGRVVRLPGKSGIGGETFTVSPSKGGLGTFAPLLDNAGNCVTGQHVARFQSLRLGMDLFASAHEV